MKKSIPLGLAMRARRICSSNKDFMRQANDIRKNLRGRGYPDFVVKNDIKRAEGINRRNLLET